MLMRAGGVSSVAADVQVLGARDDEGEDAAPWEDAVDDQSGRRPMTAPRTDQDPQDD